jgi:hypothetical protein
MPPSRFCATKEIALVAPKRAALLVLRNFRLKKKAYGSLSGSHSSAIAPGNSSSGKTSAISTRYPNLGKSVMTYGGW